MKSTIVDTHNIALTALAQVSRPLLMNGSGRFLNDKGNCLSPLSVLKEHQIMQEALDEIRGKFAYLMTNF
ncbi:MAG: hypothetical protein HGA20_14950 [Geobacteraceae bacterium]|nr:hypothetical protein [Geobacteraceae bacterium]